MIIKNKTTVILSINDIIHLFPGMRAISNLFNMS